MPKKIISDIIISKKTIRQIPISHKKEKGDNNTHKESTPFAIHEPSWKRKPLNPKFVIWLIAVICVASLIFGISILFSSALVTVVPKTQNIAFSNETYLAKADPKGASSDELTYEVLNIKRNLGEDVLATEEKDVQQKASGKIVIYNNFSTASQRLSNNTRFEAKDGRIYRISSSVVVPGYKKVGDKKTPGSVEVSVYADQAGEKFNLKVSDLLGDFTIPGLKGDVRYNDFYGRIKEDIIGGFIGKQRIVSDEVRIKAENTLKEKLREQILKELYAIKPENYLIFKDGYSIEFNKLADTPIEKDKVKIGMEAVLNAVVFNNSKLAKYIAEKKIAYSDKEQLEFVFDDTLTVNFNAKDKTALWKNNILEIKLDGPAKIKWQYDEEALKKELAGKKESDLKNVLEQNKNTINGLKVIFKPVWSRYISDDTKNIKIIEEAEKLDY